jgi:D-arabinitol dehydrogenase (NADP+)
LVADLLCRPCRKVFKITNLTDIEATLVEPAACAVHGVDKLQAPVGAEALIIGAGPTGNSNKSILPKQDITYLQLGLILAQLLKVNGASNVVIAANKSIKTQVAKDINAGDLVIELDRENPDPQWKQLKKDHPFGFDVVVCSFIGSLILE